MSNNELLTLLNTLKDKHKLYDFCKVTGYQADYLRKIRKGERNGSKYFNVVIVGHLKEYIKKSIENE